MPLSVEVKINGTLIGNLHIGRAEFLADHQQVSTYLVSGSSTFSDGRVAEFKHKYSDGALVCVQKALEAWNAS